MSIESAHQRAQSCFQSQQVGEKALKALLAAEDRDLRSHSLTALLKAIGGEIEEPRQRQAHFWPGR
ncbi:HEPN domain-containing protein [Synechococcus sp. UW140]|uniref:HEPN domain-containing protein n=1 Tax=Synechococcus sp. UW140 TaxID=368503 RepID=UPI0034581EE5